MEIIFFIYGLAFFILGFAILLYPKKGSSLEMSSSIKLIAYFGILHGINEWIDMFMLIDHFNSGMFLDIFRMATLPASFLFLVHFASKVLCRRDECGFIKYLTLIITVIWISVFGISVYFLGSGKLILWDIWSRYILCFPGAFLSGIALLVYVPKVETARVKTVTQNLKLAGFAFMAYGVLAGLIVKKADFFPASILNYDWFRDFWGVPVQIFRSVCAVVMAYSLIRVLEIFNWEIKRDLYDSRIRFNAVANQTPVILFTTDRSNKVTFIEGKGLDKLASSANKLFGRDVSELLGDCQDVQKCLKSALNQENSVVTLNLNDRILQLFGSPLQDRGHIEGVIGVVVDITDQSRTNAELNDYRDRMLEQKTLAELGAVSTEMVQKLSEPIASIKASLLTSLVTLRKLPNNPALRNPLENSLEQSSKAMDIIDRFFNFANITPKPLAEPIDIEQIVNRVLAVFKDRISRAMIRVETCGVDVVPCMFISSREMEQVFFNIIQNALQSANGNQLEVFSIKCAMSENSLKLVFRDNFTMSEYEDPNDIFEPFSSNEKVPPAASFGLVVLKRLILAYDGTIEARRKDNTNTIEITLPAESI